VCGVWVGVSCGSLGGRVLVFNMKIRRFSRGVGSTGLRLYGFYVFRVPMSFTLSSTSSMCGASGIFSVRSVPAECSPWCSPSVQR